MRKIVLDVETTHLDVKQGKCTEIGCVEIVNNLPTGNEFHTYLNPQMQVSEESIRITGITNEMLRDKPLFLHIVHALLEFIGNAPIIAHNAQFDISYINKELESIGHKPLVNEVIDTLTIARSKYRQNNTLDGLCSRFNIEYKHREKHGAMLDARLLASVYYYLIHEYADMQLTLDTPDEDTIINVATVAYILTLQEEEIHTAFCSKHNLTI